LDAADCDLTAYSPWSCLEGRWRLRRFADVREPLTRLAAGSSGLQAVVVAAVAMAGMAVPRSAASGSGKARVAVWTVQQDCRLRPAGLAAGLPGLGGVAGDLGGDYFGDAFGAGRQERVLFAEGDADCPVSSNRAWLGSLTWVEEFSMAQGLRAAVRVAGL